MNIRGIYEEFIKGGGLFISKLLCGRVPAIYKSGEAFEIPVEYMLVLHADSADINEPIESVIAAYSEQFNVDNRIRDLYEATTEMCLYLSEVDMGKTPHTYQSVYPDLILKTYGEGITNITDAELKTVSKSGRLSHVRKTAMNLLLDLISQNDYFKIIDYDFGSEETLELIDEIMQAIEIAKGPSVLKQTQRTFSQIMRGETAKKLSANLNELLLSLDMELNLGMIINKEQNVSRIDENSCVIETGTYKLTSKYKLYIDGVHVATAKAPRFKVNSSIIDNCSVIRIVPMRDIDDWFLVFNRAQLMHLHNQILDITNASSGRFRSFYKATMLAGGSLKTLRENANLKVYERIMHEIRRKDSRVNTRKCLWPLACIYTVYEQEP